MRGQNTAFCCTTPGALCFWGATFMVLYGAGLLTFSLWPSLWLFDQALVLAALGVACVVNFGVNRTFHCGITGPLFLVAAGVVAMGEAGFWNVNITMVWALLLIGIGGAAFLEWRITNDATQS